MWKERLSGWRGVEGVTEWVGGVEGETEWVGGGG